MNENKILQALMYAAEAHKDQRRKGVDGPPYVNHLIEVAFLLTNIAQVNDYRIVQAAVLHDILEDTQVTESQLIKEFESVVVEWVKQVTDDKALSLEERRAYQVDNISKAKDSVKLIKLADHCSNIATLPSTWTKERIQSYLTWSYKVASQCFIVSMDLAVEYKKRFKRASL